MRSQASSSDPCGSNAEVRMLNREVGFALNNGHRQPSLSGPKSADIVAKVFLGWRTLARAALDSRVARTTTAIPMRIFDMAPSSARPYRVALDE